MRVVVVGGGIVGLSSAYYLAERGADVTVVEKGSLGVGAPVGPTAASEPSSPRP